MKSSVRGCRILALVLLTSLAACSSLPPSGSGPTSATTAPPRDIRVAQVLAAEGIKRLQQNQYEDASRIFNAGLKFSPDDARLHFLNGLTYHLLYLRGDETMAELAVTGYQLALGADPALYDAALQLGRIEFDSKHFKQSAEAFRHATNIEPGKGEAFLGLAAAAYYDRDLATARTAIDKATPLLQGKAAGMRAAAMINAALGDDAKARSALDAYMGLEPNKGEQAQVARRIEQWRAWHAAFPAPGVDEIRAAAAAPGPGAALAQAAARPAPAAPAKPSGPREPAMTSWYDCGGTTVQPGPGPAVSAGGDESIALTALPVPCKDVGVPNMAVLDVTLVRTENNATSSHGINLLTGLTYVLNRSFGLTDTQTIATTGDTRNVTITRVRNQGLPAAGMTYSLNIANSTDARTEILARPSLVALDRQPSTFFSGRTLSVGLVGTAGGTSTVVDKLIGVSLSVTPTFVDSDVMLVSVRAARSFYEPIDPNGTFVQAIQTSRNSVTANVALRFGQTLILSGLTEQEDQRTSDGVPILQDIPLLQYLFRNKTTQKFTRSVLILITPRKPANDRDEMGRTLAELETFKDGSKREFVPRIQAEMKAKEGGVRPNVEAVYSHVLHNNLYLQFRSGDIKADDWSQASRLEDMLRQLGESLYY